MRLVIMPAADLVLLWCGHFGGALRHMHPVCQCKGGQVQLHAPVCDVTTGLTHLLTSRPVSVLKAVKPLFQTGVIHPTVGLITI